MSDEFVHDLENETVDGLAAQEVECKNYAFCESKLPRNWIEYKVDWVCTNCDMFGWRNGLEFRNSKKKCDICFGTEKQMKFPTNCGHWFCISCSQKILWGPMDSTLECENMRGAYADRKCPLCRREYIPPSF